MEQAPKPFSSGVNVEQIGRSRILNRLRSHQDLIGDREAQSTEKWQTECWDCAWSDDGKYFAWSCGQRIVKIVPRDLMQDVGDWLALQDTLVTIDCRQIVTSVAFGSCAAVAASIASHKSIVTPGYRSFHWEQYDLVLVVGLRNGRIRIYNVDTGKVLLELIDHSDSVTKLTFAPDQSLLLLSSSTDGTLKLWDLSDDGNMTHTYKLNLYTQNPKVKQQAYHAAWSPDAKRVAAVGTFKTVLIFEDRTKKCIQKLTGHLGRVTCCDFSPDGVLLVASSWDTTAIVWNSHDGQVICQFGHQFPPPSLWFPKDTDTMVRSCRFSSDGSQVVTIASDGYVRFWDLAHTEAPVNISQLTNPVSCCFNSDSSTLAVGSSSGGVSLLESPTPVVSLAQLCRKAANRNILTDRAILSKLPIPSELKSYLDYQIIEL